VVIYFLSVKSSVDGGTREKTYFAAGDEQYQDKGMPVKGGRK
jgi:hypothetical protein